MNLSNERIELIQKEVNTYIKSEEDKKIILKVLDNDINLASILLNRYKNEQKCKIEKRVYLFIGIFVGFFILPSIFKILSLFFFS